jgi:hypothetical protein
MQLVCPGFFAWLAVAAFLPKGQANPTCIDMYKTAFKGKAKVKPAEVGKLYLTYCKKNMRVGSVKSMDELCQPIVKKVEDKMVWVPPEENVTPELVCKTMDQIKAEFPEHVKVMEKSEDARKKVENAEEAERKALADKAKVLGSKFAQDLTGILKKTGEAASKELKESFVKNIKESFGGELDDRKEKMISKILETVTLGIRGLETKAKQKSEESIKEWLIVEARERTKALKEAPAKTDL